VFRALVARRVEVGSSDTPGEYHTNPTIRQATPPSAPATSRLLGWLIFDTGRFSPGLNTHHDVDRALPAGSCPRRPGPRWPAAGGVGRLLDDGPCHQGRHSEELHAYRDEPGCEQHLRDEHQQWSDRLGICAEEIE